MPMRARNAMLGAGACVSLLALVWFAAFHVGFFGRLDQSIYLQFVDLQAHSRIAWIAKHFVRLFDPSRYIYLALVPLVAVLLRRRPRVVLAVGVMLLGANVTTEV